METMRLGSITEKNVMPCLGVGQTERFGSMRERNKSAMACGTNSLQSRDLKVERPPSLEKCKEQQAKRGLLHSDRPADLTEASSEANYMKYLKERGYGDASVEDVKEQQAKLRLFQTDRAPIKHWEDSLEAASEASYIRYLKEKGYGSAGLEEVKDLQAKLGLFHSGPVSYGSKASQRSGRRKGEQGSNVSTIPGDYITKGGWNQTPHSY